MQKLSPSQYRLLHLIVTTKGDPWSEFSLSSDSFGAFKRTLYSLDRQGLIGDGRYITEDGFAGPRYTLTEKGQRVLLEDGAPRRVDAKA